MFILKNRTIGSRTLLAMNANNIHNLNGLISGKDVVLDAVQDINNIGGAIAAQNSLTLNAGRDINVQSTTQSSSLKLDLQQGNKVIHVDNHATNIDRVAGFYITKPTDSTNNSTGLMVVNAGNNINLAGAEIVNMTRSDAAITTLKAGNNISLSTVTTTQNNSYVRNAKNYNKDSNSVEVGSRIQTAGDISLEARQDVNIKASSLNSTDGALQVIAGDDINIEAGTNTYDTASASYKKKSGFMSSSSSTRRNTSHDTEAVGSNLSADSITLVAGAQIAEDGKLTVQQGTGDINITGSNVVATHDVKLNAGADINITNATDTHEETHFRKDTKRGFSASGSSVSYGSSRLRTTNDTQTTTNVASTVGSIEGDVTINAGNTYNQTGSDVLAPKGDISIEAEQVNIVAGQDTYANQQTMKFRQSGITVGVSSPVLSAVQTVQQMAQAASQTTDTRMQALAAGTAALAASNALDAVNAANTPKLDEHGLEVINNDGLNSAQSANLADQVGGISLNISIGTSRSSSSSQQTSTTAVSCPRVRYNFATDFKPIF